MTNINFQVRNPETAYILGYLWADGSVFKDKTNRYHIRLFIQEIDGNVLIPIVKKFSYHKQWKWYRHHYTSKTRNNKPKINFELYSTSLAKFFVDELGYGNKSKNNHSQILNFIPKRFHAFFWRGLFDGDGCINANPGTTRLSITSRYEQDWSSVESILKQINITNYKVRRKICKKHGHKSSIIDIFKVREIIAFGNYIYQQNPEISLPRKYNKFVKLKQRIIPKPSPHIGIYYYKQYQKWKVEITHKHKKIFIGYFSTEQDALLAKQEKQKQLESQTSV